MSVFTKKEIIILLIGGVLSALSCVFCSDGGESDYVSTPVSMAISVVFITIASTLSLEQQLMFVALALPNTKALGFYGISCSIIVCAIAVVMNLRKTKNVSNILFISAIYLLYCTQFIGRFGDIKLGLVMPIKTGVNLLFFYILASNFKIASNSFNIGFKAAVALFVGIVSAFWISYNQAETDTTRVAIEGNDPNILAVESVFVVSYMCVYYYSRKSFSKWLFLGTIIILLGISLLCGSRMGLLLMGFVVGISILLNIGQIKRSSLLIVVFGGALMLFLLSSTGQAILEALIIRNENLESHGDISNHRFDLWAAYISVFNSDPILWLIGLGNYREYGILKQAHNFLIEDLAAYGIIGVSILYLSYRSIYVHQYKYSKRLNSIRIGLFSKIPFLVPIIGGLTLHGLTSIMNTTMLYLGVLCMTLPKKGLGE